MPSLWLHAQSESYLEPIKVIGVRTIGCMAFRNPYPLYQKFDENTHLSGLFEMQRTHIRD